MLGYDVLTKLVWGTACPQAFTDWGSFIFDLKSATIYFIKQLYQYTPPPKYPVSDNPKKRDRNAEIRQRKADGESVPDLAKAFNISKGRVYQILKGKRK